MSPIRIGSGIALALASVAFAPQAFSHVTLAVKEAPVDSRYQAVLRVPHGCKGSSTTRIHIHIPEGVIGVKPQPKAGWTLETVKGDYAQDYTQRGATIRSGVKEIVWTGGPLPDEHYDEFVLVSYLSSGLAPDSSVYFPVVQECEEGVERWVDIPSAGHGHDHGTGHGHSSSPAPGLKLLPKQ